jgi:hypothetical protein
MHLRVMKKQITILTTAVLAITWCSCNNQAASAGAATGQASTPASSASSPASSPGDDMFSATIDGQSYAGKVSTASENVGLNQMADDKNPYVVITLGDIESNDDQKVSRSFRLVAAKKTGTVHLTKEVDIPNYGLELDYLDGDFARYRAEDMTLNIVSISDTRIKGNFSGKMFLSVPKGKPSVMVDAKFDVPVVTPPGQ